MLFSRPTLLAEVRAGVAEFLTKRGLSHPHQLRLEHAAEVVEGNITRMPIG